MNTLSLERRESGPAHLDRTSSTWGQDNTVEKMRVTRDLAAHWLAGLLDRPFEDAMTVRDFDAPIINPLRYPMRLQTVGEVVADALDYRSGPQLVEVLAIVAAAARGEDVRDKAASLIATACAKWADVNVEAV